MPTVHHHCPSHQHARILTLAILAALPIMHTACPSSPDGGVDELGACDEHAQCDVAGGYWCIDGSCSFNPDYSAGVSWDDATDDWSSPTGYGSSDEPTEIGAPIDDFCGVTAYQNGPDVENVVDWNGTFGLEYQCTELAFRFLCQTYGLCAEYDPDSQGHYGDARAWFNNEQGNTILAQLTPIPNNSTLPPEPGDVLTFNYGTYGHVAVVKEVDLAAGVLTVLEQNCYACSHQHVIYRSGDQYSVAGAQGWLRQDDAASHLCTTDTGGCTGTIDSAIADGESLFVAGAMVCDAGIEKWSLVVDTTTVYSEYPTGTDASFAVTVDLAPYNLSPGNYALGLWARPEDQDDGVLLDDTSFTLEDDGSTDCDAHASTDCYGGDVWWFDSCDNAEELLQDCEDGCQDGECTIGCTDHTSYQCSGNSIYWYDSCGEAEGVMTSCASCETCTNTSGSTASCETASHDGYTCNGSDLYWYDACGSWEDMYQNCTYACSGTACADYAKDITSYPLACEPDGSVSQNILTATSSYVTDPTGTPKVVVTWEKCDGSAFSTTKTCYVHIGTYESYGIDRTIDETGNDWFSWTAGNADYVTTFDAWPSTSPFSADACGTTKEFFVVCDDSSAAPDHWWSSDPVTIEKICE